MVSWKSVVHTSSQLQSRGSGNGLAGSVYEAGNSKLQTLLLPKSRHTAAHQRLRQSMNKWVSIKPACEPFWETRLRALPKKSCTTKMKTMAHYSKLKQSKEARLMPRVSANQIFPLNIEAGTLGKLKYIHFSKILVYFYMYDYLSACMYVQHMYASNIFLNFPVGKNGSKFVGRGLKIKSRKINAPLSSGRSQKQSLHFLGGGCVDIFSLFLRAQTQSFLFTANSLQKVKPFSIAVKDQLLPELIQTSVVFHDKRRVKAAHGFCARRGRRGQKGNQGYKNQCGHRFRTRTLKQLLFTDRPWA